jgi:hypothetical protein
LTVSSGLDTLLVLQLVLGLGNASLKDTGVSKINYTSPVSIPKSSSGR